jgi:hypothetical protein
MLSRSERDSGRPRIPARPMDSPTRVDVRGVSALLASRVLGQEPGRSFRRRSGRDRSVPKQDSSHRYAFAAAPVGTIPTAGSTRTSPPERRLASAFGAISALVTGVNAVADEGDSDRRDAHFPRIRRLWGPAPGCPCDRGYKAAPRAPGLHRCAPEGHERCRLTRSTLTDCGSRGRTTPADGAQLHRRPGRPRGRRASTRARNPGAECRVQPGWAFVVLDTPEDVRRF